MSVDGRQCVEYFNRYADHFNLRPYIRFNTRVQLVKKADDYEATGRYSVTYQEQGKELVTEQFDIVMVCSGHHWKPRTPTFKGLDKFKGHAIHSHAYKDQVGYENKHVLVVGVGNSGACAPGSGRPVRRVARVLTAARALLIGRLALPQAWTWPSS